MKNFLIGCSAVIGFILVVGLVLAAIGYGIDRSQQNYYIEKIAKGAKTYRVVCPGMADFIVQGHRLDRTTPGMPYVTEYYKTVDGDYDSRSMKFSPSCNVFKE